MIGQRRCSLFPAPRISYPAHLSPVKLSALSLRPRLANPTLLLFLHFNLPLPVEVLLPSPHPSARSLASFSSFPFPRACHPVPSRNIAVSLPAVPRTQPATRSPGGDSLQLATHLLPLFAPLRRSELGGGGTSGWETEPKAVLDVLLPHPLLESPRQQEKAGDPAQPSTPAPVCEHVPSPVPAPPYRCALVAFPKAEAGAGLHPRPATVLACAGPSRLLISPGLR